MQIDDCVHTFEGLALKVLPGYLRKLQLALESPWPAILFSRKGYGPKGIAQSVGVPKDFSGCYALTEPSNVIYVGISRGVLARVRQHMIGKTHFDASLAYAMAQKRRPTEGQRSVVMTDEGFRKGFMEAQIYLRSLHVAAVEIGNPLELYLFEAFAALAFETSEWNTFRTH